MFLPFCLLSAELWMEDSNENSNILERIVHCLLESNIHSVLVVVATKEGIELN